LAAAEGCASDRVFLRKYHAGSGFMEGVPGSGLWCSHCVVKLRRNALPPSKEMGVMSAASGEMGFAPPPPRRRTRGGEQ
jgi:hypothetical protein